MIASGNLTDLVYTSDSAMITQLSNQEISYPWNELIEKYAPDFKISEIEKQNNTTADRNIYAVRNMFISAEDWENPYLLPHLNANSMSIRKDIMAEMGNPPLNTYEDLEAVLERVKNEYPDLIPLLISYGPWFADYFYMHMGMDVGGTNVFVNNGDIEHKIKHPAFKNTLMYMNKLYRNGYIPAESLIYGYEQYNERINSGKSFAFIGNVTTTKIANNAYDSAGLDAEAELVDIFSDDIVLVNDGIGWSATFISKKCSDPDTAINFLKYMKSEEGQRLAAWGIEGEHYTLDENGVPMLTEETAKLRNANYNKFVQTTGIGAWSFGVSGKMEPLLNYYSVDEEILNYLKEYKKGYVFRPWLHFVVPRGDIDESAIMAKVNEMMNNNSKKIVTSPTAAQAEAEYNSLIEAANKAGLRELESWMTAKYMEVKDRYE